MKASTARAFANGLREANSIAAYRIAKQEGRECPLCDGRGFRDFTKPDGGFGRERCECGHPVPPAMESQL